MDARTWWKIEGGTFVLLGIMPLDEIKYWVKMPLPLTLSDVVSEITDENMDMNVRYFDPKVMPHGTSDSLDIGRQAT